MAFPVHVGLCLERNSICALLSILRRVALPGAPKGTLKSAIHTVLHDLHLRKDPPPPGKFNGAQQITYTIIILMGALATFSGIAIYKPVQSTPIVGLLGGYHFARIIHFLLMLGFVGFFVIHVGQVIKTGWNNFRAMVTGFELAPAEDHATTH